MTLKRVYCQHFPLQGYVALTCFPWLFIRQSAKQRFTPTAYRHELTHAHQQVELLWLLFFIIYGLEYIVKLLITFSHNKAYHSISFEQEAYATQGKVDYNTNRKHYAWIKYVFTLYNK